MSLLLSAKTGANTFYLGLQRDYGETGWMRHDFDFAALAQFNPADARASRLLPPMWLLR